MDNDKREAAIEQADELVKDTQLFSNAYKAGFRDGAASIDRVAIVREAFHKAKEMYYSDKGQSLAWKDVIDRVLATYEEEGNDL